MSETLHDEEPKVGARALQGLGRGGRCGVRKSPIRWGIGLFRCREVLGLVGEM